MLLIVKVLKMGMPNHIFLSSFDDACRVSRGKKEILYDAGVLLSVKVLKKGMPELIFLFSFLDTCLGKKYDAGLYFRISACKLDLRLSACSPLL